VSDLEHDIRKDLTTIAGYWPLMLDLPRAPGGEHVDTTPGAPPPVPIGVLSLRRETTYRLGGWAYLIHTERKLAISLDLMNVEAVATFIDIHADWLAQHRRGPLAATQIARLATDSTEMIEQTQPHRVLVGNCPDCSGHLIAIMRTSDAVLPCEVRCNRNPTHTWTPSQWRGLGARVNSRTMHYEQAASRLVAILAKS